MTGLASDERDPQIKANLNKSAAEARNLPASRLETAVAALQAKAKDLADDPIVWSWHTSREGGFRGEFPGTPVSKSRAGTSRAGKSMSASSLATQATDGSSYTMLSVQMDVALPNIEAVDLLLSSLYPGVKVVSKSEFNLDGHRGRQVVLKSERSTLQVRAIAVNNALVQAIVESPGNADANATAGAKRFFESMQLVETSDNVTGG
jgi:hypothetical protein